MLYVYTYPKNGIVNRNRDFFISTRVAFLNPKTNTNPDKNSTLPSPNNTESNKNITPNHKNNEPSPIKKTPIFVLSDTLDDIKFMV